MIPDGEMRNSERPADGLVRLTLAQKLQDLTLPIGQSALGCAVDEPCPFGKQLVYRCILQRKYGGSWQNLAQSGNCVEIITIQYGQDHPSPPAFFL